MLLAPDSSAEDLNSTVFASCLRPYTTERWPHGLMAGRLSGTQLYIIMYMSGADVESLWRGGGGVDLHLSGLCVHLARLSQPA